MTTVVTLFLLPAMAGAVTYNFTGGIVQIRATLEGTSTSVLDGPSPYTILLGGSHVEFDPAASPFGTITELKLVPAMDFTLDLNTALTGGTLDLIQVTGAELNQEIGATADLASDGTYFLDTRMKAWVEGIAPVFPNTFVTEVTGAASGTVGISGNQITLGIAGVNLARFEQLGIPDPNAPKIEVKADFTFFGVVPEPGTGLLMGLGSQACPRSIDGAGA